MIKNKTLDIKNIFQIYLKYKKQVKNILDFQTNFLFYLTLMNKFQKTIIKNCFLELFSKTLI